MRWLWKWPWLTGTWLVFVALMVTEAIADPFVEDLTNPGNHYVNLPGDLQFFLGLATLEVALILSILRPWSYDLNAKRAGVAIFVLLPFVFLSLLTGAMHMGGIGLLHSLWSYFLLAWLIRRAFVDHDRFIALQKQESGDV